MKANIDHTDDGMVVWNFPMEGAASGGHMNLTADQAETMAHALILQAYMARGHLPTAEQYRKVKGWVLR